MPQGIGLLLAVAGFGALVLGAAAMVKPFKFARLSSRPRGLGVAVVGIAAWALGASLMGAQAAKPAAAEAASAPVDHSSEIKAVWADVLTFTGACDGKGEAVQTALETGEPVTAYEAAKTAEGFCFEASSSIAGLKPPPGLDAAKTQAFVKALGDCRSATGSKWFGYRTLAKAIDEGLRPSVVASYRSSMESAQAQTLACVAGYTEASAAVGVQVAAS